MRSGGLSGQEKRYFISSRIAKGSLVPTLRAYLEAGEQQQAAQRLRIHPNVLALFTRIFGEPALAHPMFVQRNIFPQTERFDFTTGEHQDRVHIGGATSYALWMPLGDCPRAKGARRPRGPRARREAAL